MTDSTRACERGVLSASDTAVSEKLKSIEKTGFVLYIYIFFLLLYILRNTERSELSESEVEHVSKIEYFSHTRAPRGCATNTHIQRLIIITKYFRSTLSLYTYIFISIYPPSFLPMTQTRKLHPLLLPLDIFLRQLSCVCICYIAKKKKEQDNRNRDRYTRVCAEAPEDKWPAAAIRRVTLRSPLICYYREREREWLTPARAQPNQSTSEREREETKRRSLTQTNDPGKTSFSSRAMAPPIYVMGEVLGVGDVYGKGFFFRGRRASCRGWGIILRRGCWVDLDASIGN